MHDKMIMLFFIEQVNFGVHYTAVNDIYLYKVPITWISLYFFLQRYSCIFESTVPTIVCGGSVFGLCFVMHYFICFLVLQSS